MRASSGCSWDAAVPKASCFPRANSAGARESPCSQPSPCSTSLHVPAPSGLIPPAAAGGLAVEHPYEREQFRCNLAKLAQEGNAGHGIIRTTAVQGHQHGIGPQDSAERTWAASASVPALACRAYWKGRGLHDRMCQPSSSRASGKRGGEKRRLLQPPALHHLACATQ